MNRANNPEPITLSRVALIWLVMILCLALSLASNIAMFASIDRWHDCGRLSPELDLAAVGSLTLGASALAIWFWLRPLRNQRIGGGSSRDSVLLTSGINDRTCDC
jgi:hypothetical protein